MGYRIEYGGEMHPHKTQGTGYGKTVMYSILAFAFFSFLVRKYWNEGWEVLQTACFPWQTSTVEAAAENFVQSVRSGVGLSDAAMSFCTEIIFHGQG